MGFDKEKELDAIFGGGLVSSTETETNNTTENLVSESVETPSVLEETVVTETETETYNDRLSVINDSDFEQETEEQVVTEDNFLGISYNQVDLSLFEEKLKDRTNTLNIKDVILSHYTNLDK